MQKSFSDYGDQIVDDKWGWRDEQTIPDLSSEQKEFCLLASIAKSLLPLRRLESLAEDLLVIKYALYRREIQNCGPAISAAMRSWSLPREAKHGPMPETVRDWLRRSVICIGFSSFEASNHINHEDLRFVISDIYIPKPRSLAFDDYKKWMRKSLKPKKKEGR